MIKYKKLLYLYFPGARRIGRGLDRLGIMMPQVKDRSYRVRKAHSERGKVARFLDRVYLFYTDDENNQSDLLESS